MRILENTTEFQAYEAAKNGLLDTCDMDTLSNYIQPGDKSIDLALAGASSAGKQTLVNFLIEHGADKKYVLLGKIYPLYQSIIQQADADVVRALIEFARYFFHFPYRNDGYFNSSELDNSSNTDIQILCDGVAENAKIKKGHKPVSFFAFFIRDANEKIVGGCNGTILHGWLYVDQLWVTES